MQPCLRTQYIHVARRSTPAAAFCPLPSSDLQRLREPTAVGSTTPGLLFLSAAAAHQPLRGAGVVLVPEWWGIDSHMIRLALDLTAAGCVVFCLDCFRDGADALPVDSTRNFADPEALAQAYTESGHKMRTANWRVALEDVEAVGSWLLRSTAGAADDSEGEQCLPGVPVGSVHLIGASFGAVRRAGVDPLQNSLVTFGLQWQSRGNMAYLTGVSTGNACGRW